MNASFENPKIDKYVYIRMTDYEAMEIRKFIGGSSTNDRKEICSHTYNDRSVGDLFLAICELLGENDN